MIPADWREQLRRLLRHNVIRNAGMLYLVQFGGYIFPLLTLPYLTRTLSEEKFGLVAYAQAFMWYFMTITDYGFNLTATRRIAVERDSPQQVSRIFSAVMVARALLTVAGLALLCGVVLAIPQMRPHLDLYLITFLTVVGSLLFPLWLYLGLEQMQQVALRDFLAKFVALVAVFVLVRGDEDYLWAAGAQASGMLLAGCLGLLLVPRLGVRFVWPRWAEVEAQLREGWTGFVSIAAGSAVITTNTFVLGIVSSTAEVAYLASAWRIVTVGRSLVMPLGSAVFPFASQKAARSELDVIQFVRKYGKLLYVPFLAGSALVAVVAPWGMPLFLGERYTPAVPVLQLLAMTVGLSAVHTVYSTYYMLPCGYDKIWMRTILQAMVVNFVVLAGGLLWLRGSLAVALAVLCGDVVSATLYWRFFVRKSRELSAA